MGFKVRDVDKGWSSILKGVKAASGQSVRVGILDQKVHPKSVDGKTIAELAAINEFGTEMIPSRPAWRNGIEGGKDQILQALERTALSVLEGKPGSQKVALVRVGLLVQKLIRESIDRLTEPPNAPSWIRRKGNDKPLHWTGATRAAVNFEIIEGGKE